MSVEETKKDSMPDQGMSFQFSTRWMLKLTLVFGVIMASVANFGVISLWVILPMLFIAYLVLQKQYDVAGGIFLLMLMAACLIPPSLFPQRVAKRSMCSNHLRQIQLALLNYESSYGHFPPAFTTDAAGNKLHSWRVLILPFTDGHDVYDQLDLTKPWDHPVNAKFAGQMPEFYRCPSDTKSKSGQTTYLAVVGPNTMWPADGTPRIYADIKDGTLNTICIIETTKAVNWMEPVDIDFAKITKNKAGTCDLIQSPHTGGTNTGWADGSVRFISSDLVYEDLISLLTIDGGEIVEDDFAP